MSFEDKRQNSRGYRQTGKKAVTYVYRQKPQPPKRPGAVLVLCAVLVLAAAAVCAVMFGRGGTVPKDPGAPGSSVPVSAGSGAPVSSEGPVSSEPMGITVGTTPEESPTPEPTLQPGQLEDPLLVLVNAETPIPDDWEVTPRLIGSEEVDIRMYDDFNAMANAAAEDNVWLWIASGYRSVEDQEFILERGIQRRMNEYGMDRDEATEHALRTINPPGYSEHHTGLCIDLNDVSDDFENTETYAWLSAHSAEYGFVQRYKQSKFDYTGIDNESWHYRYVGREHALRMEELDMCLEEYVLYVKQENLRANG